MHNTDNESRSCRELLQYLRQIYCNVCPNFSQYLGQTLSYTLNTISKCSHATL